MNTEPLSKDEHQWAGKTLVPVKYMVETEAFLRWEGRGE